jgi:uncharacterized membrane protein
VLRKIRTYFITGLVVILPAVLTFMILRFLYIRTVTLILEPISNLLIQNTKPYLPDVYFPFAAHLVKFLVFVAIIISIVIIGLAARIFFIRRTFSAIEYLFLKLPMIGKIYISIKQISSAFLGQGLIFERAALLEYPRKGIYSIGFVTTEAKQELQKKTNQKMISIFLPTTPNPTSGVFLLVPEREDKYLDMSVEEALKLVVSGGKVTPLYKETGESK